MVFTHNASVVVFAALYSDSLLLRAYGEDDFAVPLWEEELELGTIYTADAPTVHAQGAADVVREQLAWRFKADERVKLFLLLADALIYRNKSSSATEYLPELKKSLDKEMLQPLLALGRYRQVQLLAVTEVLEPQLVWEAWRDGVLLNYLPKTYALTQACFRLERLCRTMLAPLALLCLALSFGCVYLLYDVHVEEERLSELQQQLKAVSVWRSRRDELQQLADRLTLCRRLEEVLRRQSAQATGQLRNLAGGMGAECWLSYVDMQGNKLLVAGQALSESGLHASVEWLQASKFYKQVQLQEVRRNDSGVVAFRIMLEVAPQADAQAISAGQQSGLKKDGKEVGNDDV